MVTGKDKKEATWSGGKYLTMESTVATLSLKFYEEQCVHGWKNVKRRIRRIPADVMQVIAIQHDKDVVSDDIWEPSNEKIHFHVYVRILNNGRARVAALLDKLGVAYRQEEDENLWKHHGVESCRSYVRCAMYATHETEDAIRDGKALYPVSKIVSNLTPEELEKVRAGYILVKGGGRKVSKKDMAQLDDFIFHYGKKLGDYDEWLTAQRFLARDNSSMRIIEQRYYQGVEQRVSVDGYVNRLCVFIQGDSDTGKTYAAEYALRGKRYLNIEGGGTGKFDKLLPSTEAIIINDDICPNLLNISDKRMCKAYRRNKNNPYWCGSYLIITSNLSFREWLIDCGMKVEDDSKHYQAMLSRFYVCHVAEDEGVNCLICDSPSTRGSADDQRERKAMFIRFRDAYNESLSQYQSISRDIDFSDIIGAPSEIRHRLEKQTPETEEPVEEKTPAPEGKEEASPTSLASPEPIPEQSSPEPEYTWNHLPEDLQADILELKRLGEKDAAFEYDELLDQIEAKYVVYHEEGCISEKDIIKDRSRIDLFAPLVSAQICWENYNPDIDYAVDRLKEYSKHEIQKHADQWRTLWAEQRATNQQLKILLP